ncbi:MAG: hypothetical protein RRZ24_05275 [Clostridia bacterium]
MCDTIGFISADKAIFGKNSDRSPNEPQVLELHPPRAASSGAKLHVTYMDIFEASRDVHATLLSRPAWMWGAEIGVNDIGVCIGNEAVFTKGAYGKTGLTGMDLVRLGLERGDSAMGAMETIIALLETYGQGGNCGFDHEFYYDNSFLIMDQSNLFILETAGKKWVYRKCNRCSISNRVSIGKDGAKYSDDIACDFAKQHLEPLYSTFSGSKIRRTQTQCGLADARTVTNIMTILRTHAPHVKNPFAKGSVSSTCMHAGGIIGDHTTSSMIVEIGGSAPVLWVTGGSAPCISLFKPYLFGNAPTAPIFAPNDPAAQEYWLSHERFARSILGRELPKEYYAERDGLEANWLATVQEADTAGLLALSIRACAEEAAFYEKWAKQLPKGICGSRRFFQYWNKKSAVLGAVK